MSIGAIDVKKYVQWQQIYKDNLKILTPKSVTNELPD